MTRRIFDLLSLRKIAASVPTIIAVAITCLIVFPASTWHRASLDGSYSGFDPNLVAVSNLGPIQNSQAVDISPSSLTMTAQNAARPTVSLITTPLSFSISFDAVIRDAPQGAVPLQVGLWAPEAKAGYFLVFTPANRNAIEEQAVIGGQSAEDLIGGTTQIDHTVGHFVVGSMFTVTLIVDRAEGIITSRIFSDRNASVLSALSKTEIPDLFKTFRWTLTLSSWSPGKLASVVVSNYRATLPAQPPGSAEETLKVDDALASTLVLTLALLAIGLCLAAATRWIFTLRHLLLLAAISEHVRPSRRGVLIWLALIIGGAAYVGANMLLFRVGSPHFDIALPKIWSYIAFRYGITDLYYRPLLVPAASAWPGVPTHESVFPYGFTKAYYYLAVGSIDNAFLSGPLTDYAREVVLKLLDVGFGVADGVLTYFILSRLVSRSAALTSTILFLLNPAIIFVMSVWGSTETISLFFVLLSILLAEKRMPIGAWLMLAAAAFTRPQMLVLSFLLGFIYLTKFGLQDNLRAITWTVIIFFLCILPFAVAISPSVAVDYVAQTFSYHLGNGQADPSSLGLSPANYSVWTLPMLLVNHQQGWLRMWSPSTSLLIGPVTYGAVGTVASITLLVGVALLVLTSRRFSQAENYLPLVTFGVLGWLIVTPGVISRYLVYAVAMAILCRSALTVSQYLYVVGLLSLIAFVSMYGHMASDFLVYSGNVSVLSPANNQFSNFVYGIFVSDRFITFASLMNLVLFFFIGALSVAKLRRGGPAPLPAMAGGG